MAFPAVSGFVDAQSGKGEQMLAKERKKQFLDFRYYDLPQNEPYLLFYGPGWRRVYGYDQHGQLIDSLHFHNCLEIGICLKGHGTLQHDAIRTVYHENTVSIVPKNMPHNTRNAEGEYSEWVWLFVDERPYLQEIWRDNPKAAESAIRNINRGSFWIQDGRADTFLGIIRGIIHEQEQQGLYYREEIHAMLVQLLLLIGRKNQNDSENGRFEEKSDGHRFRKGLSYIDGHFKEQITIEQIASAAGFSESYFRSIFRANMNVSPLEYLNMIRIQNACTMLSRTDETVEHIALKCGFPTISTFNRNFQKYLHERPLQWRKIHQGSGRASGMHVMVHEGWY